MDCTCRPLAVVVFVGAGCGGGGGGGGGDGGGDEGGGGRGSGAWMGVSGGEAVVLCCWFSIMLYTWLRFIHFFITAIF